MFTASEAKLFWGDVKSSQNIFLTYRFFIIYIDGSTAGAAENENFSRRLGAVELVQIYLEETLCSDDKRRKSFDKDIPNSWVIESHTVAINLSSMVLIS
jgi:hypothetical protein